MLVAEVRDREDGVRRSVSFAKGIRTHALVDCALHLLPSFTLPPLYIIELLAFTSRLPLCHPHRLPVPTSTTTARPRYITNVDVDALRVGHCVILMVSRQRHFMLLRLTRITSNIGNLTKCD